MSIGQEEYLDAITVTLVDSPDSTTSKDNTELLIKYKV
jgi:hypothetical protein